MSQEVEAVRWIKDQVHSQWLAIVSLVARGLSQIQGSTEVTSLARGEKCRAVGGQSDWRGR